MLSLVYPCAGSHLMTRLWGADPVRNSQLSLAILGIVLCQREWRLLLWFTYANLLEHVNVAVYLFFSVYIR